MYTESFCMSKHQRSILLYALTLAERTHTSLCLPSTEKLLLVLVTHNQILSVINHQVTLFPSGLISISSEAVLLNAFVFCIVLPLIFFLCLKIAFSESTSDAPYFVCVCVCIFSMSVKRSGTHKRID